MTLKMIFIYNFTGIKIIKKIRDVKKCKNKKKR